MNGFMVSILTRGEARPVMESLRKDPGLPGGTLLSGRGTAGGLIMSMLGLGDTEKDVLYSVLTEDLYHKAVEKMAARKVHGVAVLIPCLDTFIAGKETNSETEEDMDTRWDMIQVICNDGYEDDIMVAAKKAGATGGTILRGMGTAAPEDAKFFGFELFPEKGIVMIIAEKALADKIYDAIKALPFLQKKNTGIIYRLPVKDFTVFKGK